MCISGWREIFGPANFDDWQNRFTRPELSDIAALYSAYVDLLAILDHAEREYIGEEFAKYSIFPQTLRVKKKYDRGAIEMIGGVNQIRKNKEKIERGLFVMKQVFAYCVLQRSCSNAGAVSGLKAAIQALEKGDALTIQGSDDAVSKRRREEAEARAVLFKELFTSLEAFVENRVRAFYEVLAETPLPAEVFNPYALGQNVGDETRNMAWRKAAMRTIVNDLIYFERVDPWSQQFCRRSRAVWMCLAVGELREIVEKSGINISDNFVKIAEPVADKGNWVDYDPVERECSTYYAKGLACP